MGVSTVEPTPFSTSTSMGIEVSSRAGTKATASRPTMDSSMARKLQRNMAMADLLICLGSVTGSTCWYMTETEASWKKKYRTADQRAGPKAPDSPESNVISPAAMAAGRGRDGIPLGDDVGHQHHHQADDDQNA